MKPARAASTALGLGMLLAGVLLSFAPPRFTWTNDGLSVVYPWLRAAAVLGATLGAMAAAFALRAWARLALSVLAIAALVFAGHLSLYRLTADSRGLSARGLFGTTSIAWREISRVENGSLRVVVWGRGEAQIRIETAGFRPEDRAILDRTIARRVREASARR